MAHLALLRSAARTITLILLCCFAAHPSAVVSAATPDAATARPNVVFIYADDLGYGDLGCYGAKDIRTPHIDRLAAEGTRFTSFYVAQSVCTASRAALMTGSYPNRVSMSGALNHTSPTGLHPREKTLGHKPLPDPIPLKIEFPTSTPPGPDPPENRVSYQSDPIPLKIEFPTSGPDPPENRVSYQ